MGGLGVEALPHVRVLRATPDALEAFLDGSPGEEAGADVVVVLDLDTSAKTPSGAWTEPLERLVAAAGAHLTALLLDPSGSSVPSSVRAMAELLDGCLHVRWATGEPSLLVARPDALTAEFATRAARAIGAWRVDDDDGGGGPGPGPVRLRALLDETPAARQGLTVPIGRDRRGRPVPLDLAEAALGGSGPHGLIVGATGSGKSEVLRALLAGLVTRRSPAEIAIVCWDFKGGAAIEPFRAVPHVRGVVTNLEAEPRAVQRAEILLRAEIRRRQQLLRLAGVDGIADYRRLAEPPEALPDLLLVVDEFTELLTASPDLLDLFLSVGRLGRSLGVHLVLASQRLDEGRLRGLESHLRFRICLRTFSPADSHAVLGTSEAYRLPAAPGSGLLAVDGATLRFDGALVDDLDELLAESAEKWASVPVPHPGMWSPPLPEAVALAPLLRGGRRSPLVAPVGVVDRPEQQSSETLHADLECGHLAVVGAPRSGRSTLLRTLAAGLAPPEAADAPPARVYAIDGGDGSLVGLSVLPHVGGVWDVRDEDAVRQLIGGLSARVRGVRVADEPAPGPVVLLIDGWPRLRAAYDDLAGTVAELAAAGPAAGVHLVLTANGWQDFRPGLREQLTTRWELRLTDPYESEHGRGKAEVLPRDRPGRLLTESGHEAQIALPQQELPSGHGAAASEAEERRLLADLAARTVGCRPPAPPLRSLPRVVDLDDLPPDPRGALVLGDAGSAVAVLDLAGPSAHLAIVGAAGSGRSTTLAGLLAQLRPEPRGGTRERDVWDTDVWVVDPRRSLLPICARLGLDAFAGYAYTPSGAARLVDELAGRLRRHLPADGLAPEQLLRPTAVPRRQVLVVDDADLLGSSGPAAFGGLGTGSGALGPLTDLLPYAGDIALSVVVARRGGGASRTGYDPVWQTLLELGATGLLLSGDPTDGPVFGGVRPRPQPPGRGLLVRPGRAAQPIQVARPPRPAQMRAGLAETRLDRRTFGRNSSAL